MNVDNKFNEIIQSIKLGDADFLDQNIEGYPLAMGKNIPIIPDSHVKQFFDLIDKLYKGEVEETIDKQEFIIHVESVIYDFFINKKDSTPKEIQKGIIKDALEHKSLQEIEIIMALCGCKINGSKKIMGDFTIYSPSKNKLKGKKLISKDTKKIIENQYHIGIRVKARDNKKAKELALEYFKKFENFIYFCIGPNSKYYGAVISRANPFHRLDTIYYYKNTGNYRNGSEIKNMISQKINLSEPFFSKNYLKRFVKLLTTSSSELERKIVNSICWVGESVFETENDISLLKATIALESLLKVNDHIISPSIVSQISEGAALLIGNTFENRKKIEKDVKEIYTSRSKLVHHGSKNISSYERQRAITIARETIYRVEKLTHKNNWKNSLCLLEWYKQQKYKK